jgi:hypothetical protein
VLDFSFLLEFQPEDLHLDLDRHSWVCWGSLDDLMFRHHLGHLECFVWEFLCVILLVGVSPRGQYFSALFINNNRHFFIMFVTFKIMKSLE